MDDAWKASLREFYRETSLSYERAVRDCPESLWEASLFPIGERKPIKRGVGEGLPEAERRQAYSAFWLIAWHVLSVAHYDIEGGELPAGWGPPPPFNEYLIDWDTLPPRVWTRDEILNYSAMTWKRVDEVVMSLTDERVARPVPATHRYAGRPYAWLHLLCLAHTREHAAELNLFLGQHRVVRS